MFERFWSRLTFAARMAFGTALVLVATGALLLASATVSDALLLGGELEKQAHYELSAGLLAVEGTGLKDENAVRLVLERRASQPHIRRLVWSIPGGGAIAVEGAPSAPSGDLGVDFAEDDEVADEEEGDDLPFIDDEEDDFDEEIEGLPGEKDDE